MGSRFTGSGMKVWNTLLIHFFVVFGATAAL